MIYLYVKIHNKTGLKYLGKTVQNPYIYKGSGKRWKAHLNKHGDDISTIILFQSESIQEIKQKGIYYSNKFNVVSDNNWANLKPEEGDGGDTSMFFTEESRSKIKKALKERIITNETREKLRNSTIRNNKSRKLSDETKQKQRIANIGRDYGKWWITNGIDSKMIYRTDNIPDEWKRGRKM